MKPAESTAASVRERFQKSGYPAAEAALGPPRRYAPVRSKASALGVRVSLPSPPLSFQSDGAQFAALETGASSPYLFSCRLPLLSPADPYLLQTAAGTQPAASPTIRRPRSILRVSALARAPALPS